MRAGGASCARKKAAARSRRHFSVFFFLFSSGAFTFCASGKIKRCKILMHWHRHLKKAGHLRAKKFRRPKSAEFWKYFH